MIKPRHIFWDTTFVILYIGFTAAMLSISVMLIVMLMLDVPFDAPHLVAAQMNAAGWFAILLAPRLYRRLFGHPFSWKTNAFLGGTAAA